MKRTQLIEYGIVLTGLILGYKFFESVFSFIVQMAYEILQDSESGMAILTNFLMIVFYFTAFILLIRKSGLIADYLVKGQNNDSIPVKIDKYSVLHVALIVICIVTLLSNVAEIIIYIFEAFKREIRRRPDDFGPSEIQRIRFKTAAIQSIAALVILYFSKGITGWFIKKEEREGISFESGKEEQ